MKRIEFLDASGHMSLEWDPSDAASVDAARGDFAKLRESGYSFFRVVSQEVNGFDPSLGRLEVRRVDASEVEPRVEPVAPVEAPRRRGRPPGRQNTPKAPAAEERVVAARPMRGG